ncbi:unnamed protein product [Notodromas monacha]|uniref:Uncharacterized protein n=1 Tax=Notodromas monacha TaxID=399045 RepID=A0A7R9GID2_9CRUS|nr:unnamed protein product [Notodromas monacha]CAG0922322.1 unnamed protein product [Notodromas monacha]
MERVFWWKVFFCVWELVAVFATNHAASPHPKVMLISYDGFRFSYLGEHGPTPTFDKLVEDGVYVPQLKNVFPTKTFPNHISLVTGLYPGYHGGFSNSVYDRNTGAVVNMFNDGEKFVGGRPGVLPLWVVNEMAGDGRYSGVSMWPGATFGFGPEGRKPRHLLTYAPNMTWEARVDEVIPWFTDPEAPANFVAFYIEEPDKSGHNFGPDSEEVDAVVQKLDNLTHYIKTKLEDVGLWDEVNVILTSDHGMSPVNGTKILNITEHVDMTKVARGSSSPVLFFYALEGEEEIVEKQLRNASEALKFELYTPEDWPDKWHLGHLDHLPDFLAISPVGYAFEEAFWLDAWNMRPDNMIYGQHGFDNDMEDMHPFMIGHGPRFKPGFKLEPSLSSKAAELMLNLDIFPMICDILGVKAPSNNGSISRATPILRAVVHPTAHFANVILRNCSSDIRWTQRLCNRGIMVVEKERLRNGQRCCYEVALRWCRCETRCRLQAADKAGARSEEEQHLLVPPPFLTATEEV